MFIPLYDDNPLEHIARPYANWTIIALNILIFLLAEGAGDQWQVDMAVNQAALVPAGILGGSTVVGDGPGAMVWSTLVSYAFLHAGWGHLLGNMVFLWVFGDNVEDALGHLRYVVFYLTTAVVGGLTYAATAGDPTIPLIGASGAVAGVIAAYLVLHPRTRLWVLVFARLPLRLPAIWPLAAWVLSQFYYLLAAVDDGVGWWNHVGGMAAGALLVVVMRRAGVPLFDRDLLRKDQA